MDYNKDIVRKNKSNSFKLRFLTALRVVNREVSKIKLLGMRKYYNAHDARAVFKEYEGRCWHCGIPLVVGGAAIDSVHFTHRVPIKLGGKIGRENLVPSCATCKDNKDHIRRIPAQRIIGHNAFSDHIVQLVQAVIDKDETRINYFKQTLDLTLKDIVESAFYRPIGTKELVEISFEKNISLLVKEIADQLNREIQTIAKAGKYDPQRADTKRVLS